MIVSIRNIFASADVVQALNRHGEPRRGVAIRTGPWMATSLRSSP
jgi:hypothetical protein